MPHEPDAFSHVLDGTKFEFFTSLFGHPVEIPLPKILGLQITKFMVLELLVAGLMIAIFVPLCRRAANGDLPKGPWWNAFESLLTFVRDKIARPNLGEHDADKFVPYLWTLFIFILFCNLLGMIPTLGSPTASIYTTAGLAIISFIMFHGAAIAKMGLGHYLKSLWPHIDVPYGVGIVLSAFICAIELMGTFIKSSVLAVRLFANMFAGHLALAMILVFIYQAGVAGNPLRWSMVTAFSVFFQVFLSLLEILVAFIQAYVFTLLTALFMGMSLHPQH